MTSLFYREDISSSSVNPDKDEYRHCIKGLRLHKGRIINISDAVSFNDFMKAKNEEQKFICRLEVSSGHLKDLCKPRSGATVLIGPEGDFSKEEINAAVQNGFAAVSLGSSKLRTETAGIVACSMINFVNR